MKKETIGAREPSPLVSAALSYIEANMNEPATLASAAQRCHISKSHLCRVFKKEMGENFAEYVTKKKLAAAKKELEATAKTVGEISNELGFSCPGYFIKRFKRYEGLTPALYRRKALYRLHNL